MKQQKDIIENLEEIGSKLLYEEEKIGPFTILSIEDQKFYEQRYKETCEEHAKRRKRKLVEKLTGYKHRKIKI